MTLFKRGRLNHQYVDNNFILPNTRSPKCHPDHSFKTCALIGLLFRHRLNLIVQSIHPNRREIMKIMAVCGSGLGSSFMMEMNAKKALAKLGIEAEVNHTDLASVSVNDADVFIMASDIAESSSIPAEKIVIVKNLVSVAEFEEKLAAYFNR
jgi:phosphotransferase system, galactitol-specific IIB component